MRYGTGLRRLAFTIIEGAKETVVTFIGNIGHGVPELLGVGLIGHIVQHAGNLSILDLIEQLSATLEVIALLIDGVGTAPHDVDTFLYTLDDICHTAGLLIG